MKAGNFHAPSLWQRTVDQAQQVERKRMRLHADALLPYNDAARAIAVLRSRLETMSASGSGNARPDWGTLRFSGPMPMIDGRGNTWFRWGGRVETGAAPGPVTTRAESRAAQPRLPDPEAETLACEDLPACVAGPTVNDLGLLGLRRATD